MDARRLEIAQPPNVRRRLEIVGFVACLVVAAVALLMHVGAEPLDHGYTRYGSIAEHMVRTGDYVVPWLGDEIYVLKPPLQSWIIALPIAWLGYLPNWATHLPNLIGATASLVATWYLARRLLGSAHGATLATLILATTSTFVEHSRGERVDPLFADSIVTAMAFFHAAVHDRSGRRNRYVFLAWLALIVALYTKGPFGPIFFLAVAIPYSFLAGERRLLLSRASVAGCLVAIGAAAAWPIALISRIGIDHARELFAAAEFAQKVESWWFYGIAIPKAILPWAIFAPAFAFFLRQERSRPATSPLTLPLLWIATILVLLHLGTAKAERYLLPLLSPASILLAAMFLRAEGNARKILRATGILAASLLAVAAATAPFLPKSLHGVAIDAAPAMALACLAGLVALRGFANPSFDLRAPFALALGFLLAFAGNDLHRARRLSREDGRADALRVLDSTTDREPIVVVDIPANDQGMIESIVRRELPRATTTPGHGLVLVPTRGAMSLRLGDTPLASRIDTLRLDEIDYALWRLPPPAAQ